MKQFDNCSAFFPYRASRQTVVNPTATLKAHLVYYLLTGWTAALVVELVDRPARSAILTRRRTARHVLALAVLARVARVAVASIAKQ